MNPALLVDIYRPINQKGGVKIITVSGAHSGAGKTLIAEILLKKLKGWSAMKVTVSHREGSCPEHKDCNVCDELHSDFSIIAKKDIIEAKGKDTQRLKNAGAKEVLWLRARPEALKKAVEKAVSLFKKTKGLIIETNSALKYLEPDFAIFVKRKDSVLKPSAKEILNKIDLIITL
jgi:molybdopterin-guanine dinucleotide biosynthesis protein